MIDITLVSYLNTRPFTDGLEAHLPPDMARLHLMPPADCARDLAAGRSDIALIPAGALPGLSGIRLLPHHCIGADGPVASVCILSQCPIEEVQTLLLDPHSRSSNGLARILLAHHWQVDPMLVPLERRDFGRIAGRTAAVAIGDEATRIRDRYAYVYDLAGEWKQMTGLPFAFAVWAYRPGRFHEGELDLIDEALTAGVRQAASSAARWADYYDLDPVFAHRYLTHYIDYRFDAAKHRALELYLRLLQGLETPVAAQAG